MEHRCGSRTDVLLDVMIRRRHGYTLQGRVQNVNCDGMYIRTVLHGLHKGTVVDIEFARGCCIRGWVAHTEVEGIGVMFVSSTGCQRSEQPPPMSKQCLRCLEAYGWHQERSGGAQLCLPKVPN